MSPEAITRSRAVAEQSPRIAELIALAASKVPGATALIIGEDRRRVTYRDLVSLVEDLAAQLTRAGLEPGDRVALRTASNAEFVVALLAASRADLVVVPLDPALPVKDQCARATAAGARVMLIDGEPPGASGGEEEPAVRSWTVAVVAGLDESTLSVHLHAAEEADPDPSVPEGLQTDDAMIMFTGGTTGFPKMVPWTHNNLATSVRSIIACYGLSAADSTVAVMPLYHGHGLVAALLATLASGGTVLLPARGKFSAHTFWEDIEAAGATWYTAVPTIHQILLERNKSEPRGSRRAGLRFIRSCSAPLTPETAEALEAEFAAPVVVAFGMTEATHQVATTPIALGENPAQSTGLVGRSSGPEIRIVGSDGQSVDIDEVGEVWLRGSTVVRGYLGDPQITKDNFTDGWLRTGDLGTLSSDGSLTIRGRIKELINRGGEKISPERVEGVLSSHPGVLEVAVFAVPDKLYGEAVAAVIVPRGDEPTAEELTDFCRDRLASFEIPASFETASELPHTAKGSLDRRAVAKQFGREG